RFVTLALGHWDWHGKMNDLSVGEIARRHLAMLDRGVSALVEDLHQRGLDKDVTVVVWGEFGRSPRINKEGGREHWLPVSCALLAGGGMGTGQVIGATNRLGEFVKARPVHIQDVLAPLYHNLGIDAGKITLRDPPGRPHRLLDTGEPLRELI